VSFFETISTESKKRDLRYLVIGGLAINFYGYSRETGDLDLLIHRDNQGQWLNLFSLHSPSAEELKESPTLELPVDPDVQSRPPQIDVQAMLRRIAENMAWRNSRPGESERRAAEKVPVEFVL
jgi:hypothetical protein